VAVTLVEFLLARTLEDERRAEARLGRESGSDLAWGYSSARVLAECQARRAIIRLHYCTDIESTDTTWRDQCSVCDVSFPCDTLIALAQPFKDHPDFSSGWLKG
jgi:hypothetical protein